MHRLDFILSSKRGLGNGVRTHVNSKGKILSTGGTEEGRILDFASCRTASPAEYRLSYSGPLLLYRTKLIKNYVVLFQRNKQAKVILMTMMMIRRKTMVIVIVVVSSLHNVPAAGETYGVMVSTSAFQACHMPECGFESRLGLELSGIRMWHFLKLVVRDFLRVLWFPPLLYRLMVSANKIKLN